MKKKELEKLMYKSFDAPLSEEEKKILDSELHSSASINQEYINLLKLRKAVSSSTKDTFEPFFEERLMGKLNRTKKAEMNFDSVTAPLLASFKRIAVTAIIILVILISYNLTNGNNYSINNILGNSTTNVASAFDPLKNIIGTVKQ